MTLIFDVLTRSNISIIKLSYKLLKSNLVKCNFNDPFSRNGPEIKPKVAIDTK